ncbi:MAG: ABC transporter permease subunit [Lysinibacillus sp.]
MKSIVQYEIEKIIKNKTFIGAVIVSLFVLAGILFIGFYHSQLQGNNQENMERYHKNVKEHTGDFTDQKVRAVLGDYMDSFQGINRTSDLFSWEIADTFVPEDENIHDEMNDAMKQHEKITIDQIDLKTIKEIGFTSFATPLKFGSYVTWYDLFKVTGQLFILTSMIVILICSLVFSSDTSRNTNQLLLSTKFGRNKLTISKIIAATLISIVVFLFIQVLSLAAFYIYNNGFTGWDTSIQTNFSLELFNFPVEINQLQVFFLAIALHFISLLAIVGITTFVSSITNSPFSSLAISLGLFFLPAALTELIKRGMLYKVLNLFPINNYRVEDFLTLMNSKHDSILNYFAQNISLAIVVLLAIKIVLDCVVYQRMKQYQVS